MARKKLSHRLNFIATIQGWFFKKQKRKYQRIIEFMKDSCDLTKYENVLDIGCGNGALSAVLHDAGLKVTAIDNSKHRIKLAKKKTKGLPIDYLVADVLESLPFENKEFDVVITSYLAHAFDQEKRRKLYLEMARLAKSKVIIHDYSTHHPPFIALSEYADGGHYYQFIQSPVKELEECLKDMETCFNEVKKVDINIYTAWYICTPSNNG